MFNLNFDKPKKKVVKKDGKILLIDFDSEEIEAPDGNDMIIVPKKKEEIKKPKIKVKPPKKGKKLF